MTLEGITFRFATPSDAEAIGRLHADSWRRHYRGAYPDAYLDSDLESERIAFWTERLGEPGDGHFTIVAAQHGAIVGFAHTRLDADARWGTLLDNLHVRHTHHQRGLGTALMARTARILAERRPSSGLHLWVLKQNTAAQAFYSARGGSCVEEAVGMVRGGRAAPVLRYAWSDPSVLCPPSAPEAASGEAGQPSPT